MKTLRNKTVVITGASSGIGRAAAVAFAKRGANVVLAARRVELLEQVKDEVEGLGVKALVVPTDVMESEQVRRLIDASIEHFGQIDVLVNNAGAGLMGAFLEIPFEEIRKIIELNLVAAAEVMQLTLRTMERQGSGVVINVSSTAGLLPTPYMPVYNATKAALNSLSESVNAEYLGTNIKIVAFCPSMTQTEFGQSAKRFGRFRTWANPLGSVSAEVVAEKIVQAALKPKPLITLGWFAFPSMLFKLISPRSYSLTMKWFKQKMEERNAEGGEKQNAK